MSNEKVKVEDLTFVRETDEAILVLEASVMEEVWLPKSQIEYDDAGLERGDVIDVEMPEWLAEDKGLI